MSMNIYIPDIKLPKDEPGAFQVIVIYVGADRKLRAECEGTHEVTIVPPHGRLGDLDAAVEKLKKLREYHLDDSQSGVFIAAGISQCIEVLTGKDAPTIIPADDDDG